MKGDVIGGVMMTDFQEMVIKFLFVWSILAALVGACVLDDIRQRLKQLQMTLEEFIEDVQE